MAKLSLLYGFLITFNSFSATSVLPQRPAVYGGIVMTQEELRFVELANSERASRGLAQLTIDPLLVDVARQHSLEMAQKHYFSHNSPTPGIRTPMDRYLAGAKRRPSWALVGENLFYCSIVDVDRGHFALMNSEAHRSNILEDRFERIGVGACTDSSGRFHVTQMFLAKTD